jgi:hypothetical protein
MSMPAIVSHRNFKIQFQKYAIVYKLIWYFISLHYRFVKGKGISDSSTVVVLHVTTFLFVLNESISQMKITVR